MNETIAQLESNYMPIDILLVEDEEDDIEITLRAFKNAKLKNQIYVVQDGQEAINFIYHKEPYQDEKKFPRPDLILLDIDIPKLSGFEVLKKLKGDPNYSFIPVVMLTSSKEEQDIIKSFQNGASSYIQKPVSYAEFTKIIDGFNFYWHIVNKFPDGKRKAVRRN